MNFRAVRVLMFGLALWTGAAAAERGDAVPAPDPAAEDEEATTLGPVVVEPEPGENNFHRRIVRRLPCLGCGPEHEAAASAAEEFMDWLVHGFLPAEPPERDMPDRLVREVNAQNAGADKLP